MNYSVTTLILGGGQGTRLSPLTSYRSKPAVPIGAKYRLVDIPLSNSLNSGLNRIFVLTQFNSVSLHRHLHRAYAYEPFSQTSIELLAAEQTSHHMDWYQGTADAVRKHIQNYNLDKSDYVLILSGDHLYRMDYRKILEYHKANEADVTIATVPISKKEVSGFGIMQIRTSGEITAFKEKPSAQDKVDSFMMPDKIRETFRVKNAKDVFLASMGVYVFKPDVLIKLLSGSERDFGKEIIPNTIGKCRVFGYVFNEYWRDIGTIGAFYEASIELTGANPPFNFYEVENGRIFTRARFLPPSQLVSSECTDVLLGDGCRLDGVKAEQTVIGLRSLIQEGSVIKKSVLMGNDFYETNPKLQKVKMGIGKDCRIENCILDKNVRIGNGVSITNARKLENFDADNYVIREGIVIVPKGAVIPDGTKI